MKEGPRSESHSTMRDSRKTVRAIEFYSGIGVFRSRISRLHSPAFSGGFHFALRRSGIPGATAVVAAYDWDQTACQVYTANFGADIVHKVRSTSRRSKANLILNRQILQRSLLQTSLDWMQICGFYHHHASHTLYSTHRPKGQPIHAHSLSCIS